MFSLICAWTDGWVDNRDTGDLRGHRAHYDVTVIYHYRVGYGIFLANQVCIIFRVDSMLTPSQWETSLQSNTVSHWLGCKPRISREWWRHQTETFSALPGYWPFVWGIHAPHEGQWRGALMFSLNRRLSKQWRHQWFETTWHSLWRHCNVVFDKIRRWIGLPHCGIESSDDSSWTKPLNKFYWKLYVNLISSKKLFARNINMILFYVDISETRSLGETSVL